MQVTLSSYVLCKHQHYKATITVTDAGWWLRHGLDRYSLAFAVQKYSRWCHFRTMKEATCRVCDPKNGNVVKMVSAPMPEDTNSVEFNITPVCASTRSHIGSQIVLVVQGLPELHLISLPVSLLSRNSRKRQIVSKQLITARNEFTNMQSGDFKLLLGVEDGQMLYEYFSLLPQVAYQSEAKAHPQNTLSFSKELSQQMEQTPAKRPFIWVCILRSKSNAAEFYSVWHSCTVDCGAVRPLVQELPGGVLVVVEIFPSLASALLAESTFISRWNTLHTNCLDLMKPDNPWVDFIGWASNFVF
ncbi:hypothetical protein Pelo_8631 [Pelomyxa schiedti]|nr:hypothetical protein Pelo_8631 [Pelomyxa schiedti]